MPTDPLNGPGLKEGGGSRGRRRQGRDTGRKVCLQNWWTPHPTTCSQEPTSIDTISVKIEHQRWTQKHRYRKEQINLEAEIRKMKGKVGPEGLSSYTFSPDPVEYQQTSRRA